MRGERAGRLDRAAGGGEDVLGRAGLEHEGGRAGVERRKQVLVLVVHREDDEPDLGPGLAQRLDEVDPARAAEVDVDDDAVRLVRARQRQSLGQAGGFRHHLEVVGLLERAAETLPDQCVVIDQHHGRRRHHRLLPAGLRHGRRDLDAPIR